jgi:uncharacterized protein YbaR (Trm112 family)
MLKCPKCRSELYRSNDRAFLLCSSNQCNYQIEIPEKVEKLLEYHKSKNQGVRFLKITTTRWYEIPDGSITDEKSQHYFNNEEELIDEWFKKNSIGHSHAFRDGSLLLQYFNDDAKIERL